MHKIFFYLKITREEIISFIYKALKCESYTLFVILKAETLDLEISNFFYYLLFQKSDNR